MKRLRIALLCLLAAGAGYAVVQLAVGESSGAVSERPLGRPSPTAPTPRLRLLFAPRRPSALDAVGVAVDYLHPLSVPSRAALAALRRITLPPLTRQALRAEGAAAAVKRRLPPSVFLSGWDLGWRMVFAGRDEARVAIWTVGLLAGAGGDVPPDWSTSVCALRLTRGRWRVVSAVTVPGPTPPGSDRSSSATVGQFAGAASRFHTFTDAP